MEKSRKCRYSITIKVNKSDTYILAGVLLFTMNVDCSAPAFSSYGQ